MKKLITTLFILATVACTAQTRISRIKDLRQESIILEAHIKGGDTTYLFMFRDMQYEYIIIREASKKWFEENPDYHPAYNYYDSGEITIPGDSEYYRVPMEMWYDYHDAKYNTKMDRT